MTALLAARAVSRRYGDRVALHPTDVEVSRGQVVALVGPNGAGKSTLLALLAGALPASSGRVERAPGLRVGWAPQRPGHYGRLSARENVELFARLGGDANAPEAARRLLAKLELPDDGRPSAELSLGMRQRLNLALALLGDPDVLLADEPTASLDERARARFWTTVLSLRDAGQAVVVATQNPEEPVRFAERVVALEEGRVVFSGAAPEFPGVEAARV
ncbi:MAG: ABC transporter ATP-binding protein [Thermoleophilia bacterium]|nr:ABC transporter ATP-binding protein [Thermoleophilia bacterium]